MLDLGGKAGHRFTLIPNHSHAGLRATTMQTHIEICMLDAFTCTIVFHVVVLTLPGIKGCVGMCVGGGELLLASLI